MTGFYMECDTLSGIFRGHEMGTSTRNGLIKQYICDALRNLVLFVQFKIREKHPWRSVTFSTVAG